MRTVSSCEIAVKMQLNLLEKYKTKRKLLHKKIYLLEIYNKKITKHCYKIIIGIVKLGKKLLSKYVLQVSTKIFNFTKKKIFLLCIIW